MKKTIKSERKNGKPLTFGDLVVAAYSDRNKRRATAILRFAVNAHLVVFPRCPNLVIA